MHRRDLLKMLTIGATLPAFTPDLLAFLQQAQPSPGYALKTLNPHQNDTVVVMADLIIPATDTPGAKAVRVNEFIDVILTDWAEETERQHFLNGLDDVDKRTQQVFGKNFVDCSVPQQEEILRGLDGEFLMEHRERERRHRDPEEYYTQLQGNFFGVFRRLTLTGYYTSEVGFIQELKDQISPGSFHGCTPVPAERKA